MTIETTAQLESKLVGFYGTSGYYYLLNRKSVYTDGAKELFDLAGAWWLYDFIQFQIQPLLFRRNELDKFYFQITSKNNEADLTLVDYNGVILWEEHVDYTNFPEGTTKLYIGYDGRTIITCLPGED